MAFSRVLITPTKNAKLQLGELGFRLKYNPNSLDISSKNCLRCSHQIRWTSSQKYKHSTLLTHLTGLSCQSVNNLLYNSPHINKLDEQRILKTFNLLKNFGYKREEIAECFKIIGSHPLTLKNHYMILEEGGVDRKKLTPLLLRRYLSITREKVSVLKSRGIIKDVDVGKTYASYAGIPDSVFQEMTTENKSLRDVQIFVLKAFMAWRINMHSTEIEKSVATYLRIANKSFRLMQEAVTIIENDIGLTKEKIHKNVYLLHSDPDNIREMLNKFDRLGGVDLLKVLNANPKIISYPVENIVKIDKLLKEHNIPNDAIVNCLDIYTLSPETVDRRLKELSTIPQSSVLCDHPSILKFVLYPKKVAERLGKLEKLKIKCASVYILFTKQDNFEKYARSGEDRTRGNDIIYFLSKELSIERKIIRTNLKRHLYWYHVPLINVRDSLHYLYSKNFSLEEINKNIHILLYPKSLIDQELSKLEHHPDLGLCRMSDGKLRTETILPLILYYIELPHHFSGGGIWSAV